MQDHPLAGQVAVVTGAGRGIGRAIAISAQELWEDDISVNELIPGPVRTRATRSRDDDSVFGIGSEWIKQPEEVVPMALFMATQPATGPTAQSYSLMRRDT